MKYTHLGRTGLMVSRICLGTMNFGWHTSKEESFAIMDRALDSGVNFFDTADVYGWQSTRGLTEEIIGEWLAQGGDRRESVVLCTKVYNNMPRPDRRAEINRDSRSLSALKIIRHCEDSLRRLKTDTIDLYQMHHVDRSVPVDEVWEAMETLKRQGKIIYVGSSNFAGWDIATYNMASKASGQLGLVSEQSVYNLTNRTVELEVIPACRHFGVGLIPWSPLEGGLLAGALEKQGGGRRGSESFQSNVEKNREKLERFESLCRDIEETPSTVALAWLLANPVVTAPIIGPRTMEQFEDVLEAPEVKLSEEILVQLDEIFPGPGGEAPNAYAW